MKKIYGDTLPGNGPTDQQDDDTDDATDWSGFAAGFSNDFFPQNSEVFLDGLASLAFKLSVSE